MPSCAVANRNQGAAAGTPSGQRGQRLPEGRQSSGGRGMTRFHIRVLAWISDDRGPRLAVVLEAQRKVEIELLEMSDHLLKVVELLAAHTHRVTLDRGLDLELELLN